MSDERGSDGGTEDFEIPSSSNNLYFYQFHRALNLSSSKMF